MIDKDWLRRRFWEFRIGHNIYLHFILTFIQFILITYALLISEFSWLKAIFASVLVFAVSFLLLYPPLAAIVGHWIHRKAQLPIDQSITTLSNPFLHRVLPGKEKEIALPATMISLIATKRLDEKFGLLSPAEKKDLEDLMVKLSKLLKGETPWTEISHTS